MIVISTNNSKIFEVEKNLFEDVKNFLKQKSKEKNSSFSYIDDFGDKIVVINGIEYVEPRKEDLKAIYEAKESDFISEEKLKDLLKL